MRSNTSWLVVSVIVGVGCGESVPGGGPIDVQVDTFNVALAGAFIPYEAERRAPLIEAIAAMESDIVCLQEVWEEEDKELIRDGVEDRFPYVLSFEHDRDTPIDDPTDQDGETPPAPTTPPCAEFEDDLAAATACLAENCSTVEGSDTGYTTSADCASSSCLNSVGALLFGDAEAKRCYSCLTTNLPTEIISDIGEQCTTEVNANIAFQGQSGVMILSRHPLTNEGSFVMPGTWNRRIVAYATAELPDGALLDVYCNHLTPIFSALHLPYTGDYGEGMTGSGGWAAEQLLQAEKLISLVQAENGGRRSIVLGDFNAGRAYDDDTEEEGLATLELLESVFEPAVTEDYEPVCTHCPDNLAAGEETAPVWIDHIFMLNIPASSVEATERTFVDPVVPIEGDPSMVPLSDHYGLSARIVDP